MNDLQIFNYESNEVRTIVIDDELWWVAKDVCDILEIQNPTMSLKNLESDEVTKYNLGGLSGESNIVNESGLYSLILQSRKPEAKKFKKWITSEVLPSIRKTGYYTVNPEFINNIQDDINYIKNKLKLLDNKTVKSGNNFKRPKSLQDIMSLFTIIQYDRMNETIIVEYGDSLFSVHYDNDFSLFKKNKNEKDEWENNWRVIKIQLGSLKKGLEYILKMY